MNLAPMRFKSYVWPHNPRVYEVELRRRVAAYKVPFGRCRLQDMGMACRVFRGAGEFVGDGAYDEIKRLGSLLYEATPGVLVHPVWQTARAYFVELRLTEEPRPDYVGYSFEFWEDSGLYDAGLKPVRTAALPAGADAATGIAQEHYTVVSGDTLWSIAARHGLTLDGVIALNPGIKNPNLIHPGERIRVK